MNHAEPHLIIVSNDISSNGTYGKRGAEPEINFEAALESDTEGPSPKPTTGQALALTVNSSVRNTLITTDLEDIMQEMAM